MNSRTLRSLGLLLATLAPASSRSLADDAAPGDVRDHYHPGWVSHGVEASTPTEIARVFDALFRGRLISSASLHELTTLVPISAQVESAPWGRPGYTGGGTDRCRRAGRVSCSRSTRPSPCPDRSRRPQPHELIRGATCLSETLAHAARGWALTRGQTSRCMWSTRRG